MKGRKFLTALVTVSAGVLLLSACGGKSVYAKLNELSAKEYDEVRLKVTAVTGGETLHASYRAVTVAEGILITYTCERLNAIQTDGDGEYVLPDEAIATLSGEMLYSDGKLVRADGDPVELSPQTVSAAGLRFSVDAFTEAEITDTSFQAKVVSPAAFLRESNLVASDMRVAVEFTERALTSMTVTYNTSSGSVQMQYSFA